jgi:hypothetical protein
VQTRGYSFFAMRCGGRRNCFSCVARLFGAPVLIPRSWEYCFFYAFGFFIRLVCLCPFDLDQVGWIIVVMWGLGIRVELGFRIAAMRVKDSKGSKMCYISYGSPNPCGVVDLIGF